MMSNLLQAIKGHFTPALISHTASTWGEHDADIGKAMHGWVPVVLAGLLQKAGDPADMGDVFIQLSRFKPLISEQPDGLAGRNNWVLDDPNGSAGYFVGTLFGSKLPALTNALASFAGVKASSSSAVLGLVGPLVMAHLSKKISADGLSVSELVNMLAAERESILGALPTGLPAWLGVANWNAPTPPEAAAREAHWLWPLLLLLGLGGGMLCYLKTCNTSVTSMKECSVI